jgi:hypothetical protein
MHDTTLGLPARRSTTVATALRAAFVVAFTDGLWAVTLWTVVLQKGTAGRVFQGIARALLGDAAFMGGAATVALGVALHLAVACTWAAAYTLALRHSSTVRRAVSAIGPLMTGAVIGTVVWTVMDLVVLPLTRAHATPPASAMFAVNLAGHMLFVGLPLAVLVRQHDG